MAQLGSFHVGVKTLPQPKFWKIINSPSKLVLMYAAGVTSKRLENLNVFEIIDGMGKTYSARTVHAFLDSGYQFTDLMDTLFEGDIVEVGGFRLVSVISETNNTKNSKTKKIEYRLTLTACLAICMVNRKSPKAKALRKILLRSIVDNVKAKESIELALSGLRAGVIAEIKSLRDIIEYQDSKIKQLEQSLECVDTNVENTLSTYINNTTDNIRVYSPNSFLRLRLMRMGLYSLAS